VRPSAVAGGTFAMSHNFRIMFEWVPCHIKHNAELCGGRYPEHSCKRHDSHRLPMKLALGQRRTNAGNGRLEAACRLSDVKYLSKTVTRIYAQRLRPKPTPPRCWLWH